VGAPGLGKTCFIRNVVAGIPGAAGGRAQLGDLAAPPARTRLGPFQSAPEALATCFDVGAAADANAVYHFCFQARWPGRRERLLPRFRAGGLRARACVSMDQHTCNTLMLGKRRRNQALLGTTPSRGVCCTATLRSKPGQVTEHRRRMLRGQQTR
jgi:hypothetical protein